MSRQESTESRRLASNRLAYLQAVRGSPTIRDRHPRPRHCKRAATGVVRFDRRRVKRRRRQVYRKVPPLVSLGQDLAEYRIRPPACAGGSTGREVLPSEYDTLSRNSGTLAIRPRSANLRYKSTSSMAKLR